MEESPSVGQQAKANQGGTRRRCCRSLPGENQPTLTSLFFLYNLIYKAAALESFLSCIRLLPFIPCSLLSIHIHIKPNPPGDCIYIYTADIMLTV